MLLCQSNLHMKIKLVSGNFRYYMIPESLLHLGPLCVKLITGSLADHQISKHDGLMIICIIVNTSFKGGLTISTFR